MKRVEFKLSMPNCASWNGEWSGKGKNYSRVRKLNKKTLKFLGLDVRDTMNWYHGWSDGWGACVSARVLEVGERVEKSDGFAGYDWMINNILRYNTTKEPGINY